MKIEIDSKFDFGDRVYINLPTNEETTHVGIVTAIELRMKDSVL